MCGIIGYLGSKQALPILLGGLRRLEYRGYDSAGVALLNEDGLCVYKKQGKVAELEAHLESRNTGGLVGIGHTRWATHGEPSDRNAHPHSSPSGNLSLVHNGIIENYNVIRRELENRGHEFLSETDSEVLIHLIEDIQNRDECALERAVQVALKQVTGAYAILVISRDDPEKIVAARKGSPLVVGIGKGEYYLASDAAPIIPYTNKVVYMQDEEMAIIRSGTSLSIRTIEDQVKTPYVEELEMSLEALEKGDYDHYMLKEIHEQPQTLRQALAGRLLKDQRMVQMSGIGMHEEVFRRASRIIIVACGTSWHAGLIGEYMIEQLAGIPVEVEYASEFRYREPIIRPGEVVIAISQSGETADTLAAIEMARKKGAFIYGIVNVVGSSIARFADAGSFTHAGPEIGVASTKAFTNQVAILTMMAIQLGRLRQWKAPEVYDSLIRELDLIPGKMLELLQETVQLSYLAEELTDSDHCLYMGRGVNFPVALEGALKLKEISYVHAEGYAAAEMKHGPIALIDEEMPTVILATNEEAYEKVFSNIQETKARKGKVIAISFPDAPGLKDLADHVIEVPRTPEVLSPLLSTIPLQLLAYYIAVNRNCNVDQPRNLAKSVTVE